MIRNYIVLLLLLIVPIAILTFFYFILSGLVSETGESYFDDTALIQVLVFQLFGGSLVMYLIHNDLFTAHRMRMYTLPFNQTMYAFSIMLCGAAYSISLGFILMAYAQFVLGVVWENWAWVLLHIALIAVLSIIVSLILTFSVKKQKLAERLNELYGVGYVVLAGMFFPMPDHAFFEFMGSYGNPLTLSIMSVHAMDASNSGEAWRYTSILLAAIVLLFIIMLLAGRRRIR